MARWPSYSETRFPELGLSQLDRELWRYVDITDPETRDSRPPVVGPHYKSKEEALADLADYHRRNWEETTITRTLLDHFTDQIHVIVEGVGELSATADERGEDTPLAYRLNNALVALESAYSLLTCTN